MSNAALARPVARPVAPDAAGSLAEELAEQAAIEHLATLTGMPSLSTLHCLTSKHDTTMLPQL
ncbi:hypothetical protein ACOACO_01330 [Nocardioides sp. CPCC 205120]|uniref:hypothetical protein n=1 Tax=Nocardioides sp. CPCC 205120 TaxID=3406462 RepID=UPI003B502263